MDNNEKARLHTAFTGARQCWPFQYANDFYPNLDDTAVIAWAMFNMCDGPVYGRAITRAANGLAGMQRGDGDWGDGGWGEDSGSYWSPPRSRTGVTTSSQTAWAMLELMAAGEHAPPAGARRAAWLIARQSDDGARHGLEHTAAGYPRVLYLKYHGYTRYFPLWALARFRSLRANP